MLEILRHRHKPDIPHVTPAEIGSNLRISHEGQGLNQKEILASIEQTAALKGVNPHEVTIGYVSRNLQMYYDSLETKLPTV